MNDSTLLRWYWLKEHGCRWPGQHALTGCTCTRKEPSDG